MLKFSLIIPVYNTQDYLRKCLESIVMQNFDKEKFEAIIINDGSTDKSEEIILEFQKKYPDIIEYVKKENGGVSSARNLGIKKSKGEYLFFVDSDDYLELDILNRLDEILRKDKVDIIRINSRDVKSNGDVIKEIIIKESKDETELIKNIMKEKSLEVPWGYIFKKSIFVDNKLQFAPQVHEDFGLIPIVLYKAGTIKQLSYIGYNYVERETSLTAEKEYEKLKRRVDDMFILYRKHMRIIKSNNIKGKLLRSYSLEAMLNKLTTLNKKDLEIKLEEFKKFINPKDIYCYNFKKVIKKIILMINLKLYLYLYKKYK